jgi:GNAT superfamily N-acetyltransferase
LQIWRVAYCHGALYAAEYGWDETFEAMFAEIAADLIKTRDPTCERCWIAESDGTVVGSATVVREDAETAKLRMVYVEPEMRGSGLEQALVNEAIAYVLQTSYRRTTLWTNSVLVAARRIYETSGSELIEEEPHQSYGHDLIGEYWARDL